MRPYFVIRHSKFVIQIYLSLKPYDLRLLMIRPLQVWFVFAVCVLGAAGGMVWLTREAMRADQLRHAAEGETELEQRVSLALWRMDTELAPIIAEEVIRPPAAYRPGAVAVDPPPYVLLQCEARPDGEWVSPQSSIRTKEELPRLAELSKAVNLKELLPELPSAPLPTPADVARNNFAWNVGANASPTQSGDNKIQFFESNRANVQADEPAANANQEPNPNLQQQANAPPKISKEADFQQRNKRYQSAAQQSLINAESRGLNNFDEQVQPLGAGVGKISTSVSEQVGVSRPVWVGDRLLLARRVVSNGVTGVQGCWLDWPLLKARLLGEATDLLPKADLLAVKGDVSTDPARMLAGLPVRLVVGESAIVAGVEPTLSWALWIGWGAVLLAVAAAAVLLHGVMTLSERRAAFVSSVTHELRTPLTTFRMYAEMLARGMVPDAERRQEYYETLQRESERLTLLVENVLSYARLERGRAPRVQDRVTVASLLERVGPRLKQRAAQAGMQCEVDIDANAGGTEFTTDQAVVEQILFNLVDNAAKYAQSATDRRVHVEANRNGRFVKLIVRDHGPGIGKQTAWRSQPFGKSAEDSAESAPGVGLGLALCRRLARQLGGRLEVADAPGEGAVVTLLLPVR